MKTIEQKAQELRDEFNRKYGPGSNLRAEDVGVWIEQTFIKAAKYSQRWVNAEEELPKKNGYYLVIVEHSFPKNCRVVIAEFSTEEEKFYSEIDEHQIDDVMSWRMIDNI